MKRARWWIVMAVAAAWPFAAAQADPCAGGTSAFTDVPDSAIYCTNTQWMKNRGVTTGCTASAYCPSDVVSRASMALFMNRLGVAMSTANVFRDDIPGAFTATSTGVVQCISAPVVVAGFPRNAVINGSFSGTSGTAMTVRAISVVSTDGGTTWTPTATHYLRSSAAAGNWAHSTSFGTRDLAVGQTYLFGLSVASDAVSQSIADSRCQLLVNVNNRNGLTAPF